jgi:succinate dehydrogenase hydrophobic anchor subunit
MSAWTVGLVALLCVYGGALLGLGLQRLLPRHHLSSESKDAVKLVAGLLATLSALVLGLLIASAKGSYDAVSDALKQSAAKVVVVDRLLAQYGPGANGVRAQLKRDFADRLARTFPEGRRASVNLAPDAVEGFQRSLRALVPTTDDQRAILSRVQQLAEEVNQTGWLAFEEASGSTPPVFLAVLVSWLVMMFVSFGLFTPPNPTAFGALLFGALAVATSIFLIEEMNHPLGGFISIPSEPMRNALSVLGH